MGPQGIRQKWPSRTPVWTWAAILLAGAFFTGASTVKLMEGWTAAEKLYLTHYLKNGARGHIAEDGSEVHATGGVQGNGPRFLIDDEIEPVTKPDGRKGYLLQLSPSSG